MLRIVQLAELEHLALARPPARKPLTLHNREIAARLPVLHSRVSLQIHSAGKFSQTPEAVKIVGLHYKPIWKCTN